MPTPIQTSTPATAQNNYWVQSNLNLYFNSNSDFSLDDLGAAKYNKQATVSGNFVTEVQKDLITLGYLTGTTADGYYGGKSKRALLRFQRHAKRLYRMSSETADDITTPSYNGGINGICDHATAQEIRIWINKAWVIPIGRFKLVPYGKTKLRKDVAAKWNILRATIKSKGGTIDGPYGDLTRPLGFHKLTGGNSLYSLHYTGRAIDLRQELAGGKNQRYFVAKEMIGGGLYWRIYCKTDKQGGSQGTKIFKSKGIKSYVFFNHTEENLKEAYYIDITAMLENNGFNRIKSHSNWKTNARGIEWWHYHYDKDVQATFQDEMELVGYSEKELRDAGWNTDAKLDRKPG